MDPEEAWLRLKSGNERFVLGQPIHPHETQEWRRQMAHHAHPFATVLGCIDSSAPPELLFDQGLGDLVVIQIAGNVIAPDVLGSVQFAGLHLGTRLFVVLGHEGCRVVRAALEERTGHARQAGRIESVMRLLLPALAGLPPGGDAQQQLAAAVEANVRYAVRQLAEMPEARKAVQEHRVKVIGAVAEVRTGQVRFLE
jgi:carbonic anhydrase